MAYFSDGTSNSAPLLESSLAKISSGQSSRKRNFEGKEVENAVAIALMTLAKGERSQIGGSVQEINYDLQVAGDDELTKKGIARIGPGDNRCRPPKAATKLLLDTKWRQIRLPDVRSALEAEDWVVWYVHFQNPGSLDIGDIKDKLLNYKVSHYDLRSIEKILREINSTSGLEEFLKDRYLASKSKMGQGEVKLVGHPLLQSRNSQVGELGMRNMKLLDIKKRNKLLSGKDISTSIGEQVRLERGKPLIMNSVLFHGGSPNLIPGKTIQDGINPIPKELREITFQEKNCSKIRESQKIAEGIETNMLEIEVTSEQMDPYTEDLKSKNSANKKIKNDEIDLKVKSKASSVKASTNDVLGDKNLPDDGSITFERAGRPPSYDTMVHWCVHLKRILQRKKITLNIDHALAMVNDPTARVSQSRSLVASTLRKRVRSIYNLTWSQIGSQHDSDRDIKILDADILLAAKKYVDAMDRDSSESIQKESCLSSRDATGQGKVPSLLSSSVIKDRVPANISYIHDNVYKILKKSREDSRNAFVGKSTLELKVPIASCKLEIDHDPACVITPSVAASPSLRSVLNNITHQFLPVEDVYKILEDAAANLLPISSEAPLLPSSGSMFIFNRIRTPKFRSDGHKWKKKETHSKKVINENHKINCYYASSDTVDGFQRRSYWVVRNQLPEEKQNNFLEALVLVHYLSPQFHLNGSLKEGSSKTSLQEQAQAYCVKNRATPK